MKNIIFAILLLCGAISASATDKLTSKNGFIGFYSKTSLETIDAKNNQVASVLDTKTGSIAFSLINKSFKFPKALMEEHFNENYMESSKYPKSTFSGKLLDFDTALLSTDGSYKVNVEGKLTIHGVTKQIKVPGTIEVKDGTVLAKSKFNVVPEDYGIEIPSLVRDKIGKQMAITVEIKYDSK